MPRDDFGAGCPGSAIALTAIIVIVALSTLYSLVVS